MTEAMQRRTVLAGSGLVLASLAVAACSSSSGAADASASASTSPDSTGAGTSGGGQVLTPTSDVAVGGGVIVPDPPIVVTQPNKGEFKAFTAICPHQGCLVGSVQDNTIQCPCHGSVFSAVDGSVISGPAQVGLTTAAIAVQGSNVVLA